MSGYSQLQHDPLDLDPPTDIALDEDLLITTPDQTNIYTTSSSQQQQQQSSLSSSSSYNQNNNKSSPNQQTYASQCTPTSPIIISPIDHKRKSYPYSIVWGSLPLITWLLPCIGHLGICDSKGKVHDFHGPYDVRLDKFMTGPVLRYYQLSEEVLQKYNIQTAQQWDTAIYKSDMHYSGTVHNIVTNNCHHHVATAMTNVGYDLTMFQAFWLIMTRGSWTDNSKFISRVLVPTVITWGLIIGIIVLFTQLFK